jgi:putative transposase
MTYYEHALPHWHPAGKAIFLTWRLFGSLPIEFLKSLAKLHVNPGKQFAVADRMLDAAATGPLWLREPEIATCVNEAILR